MLTTKYVSYLSLILIALIFSGMYPEYAEAIGALTFMWLIIMIVSAIADLLLSIGKVIVIGRQGIKLENREGFNEHA